MSMLKSVIHKNKEQCYICNRYGVLHPHHIFNGSYKKKSEEDGMIIWVHDFPCHRSIHDDYSKGIELKVMAQEAWEKTYGDREKFIKRYGMSYIDRKEQNDKNNTNR